MPISSKFIERILQIAVILIFSALAYFFLKEGVGLVYAGAKGEWNILMEFTGWKLYITSVVPGVAVVFGGVAIMLWALPKAMKGLK
jgi:hypothetical protein